MPPDRNDIGFLLALASRRWNQALERRFAELGFPEVHASYGALLVPLFEEDGLRMADLARRSGLSKQALTTMARLLERDGLAERRSDEADRRSTRVFLSARGREFRTMAEAALADLRRDVADELGERNAERLQTLLGRLVAAQAARSDSRR
jgi:MarR family transcriptional regulator for hemolysin